MLLSCSQKLVPNGLRKTINELDEKINDTIKYDFKVAPEEVAINKYKWTFGLHTINGHNIKGSEKSLKTYLWFKGVSDSYEMSEIIKRTYHRELNGKPINFRQQKRLVFENNKLYSTKIDSLDRSRLLDKELKEYRVIEKDYFSKFMQSTKVTGFYFFSLEEDEVQYMGEVINLKNRELYLKILEIKELDKIINLKIGDTLKTTPYDVFLIPTN